MTHLEQKPQFFVINVTVKIQTTEKSAQDYFHLVVVRKVTQTDKPEFQRDFYHFKYFWLSIEPKRCLFQSISTEALSQHWVE